MRHDSPRLGCGSQKVDCRSGNGVRTGGTGAVGFLYYCNGKGKYADFHGLRHTFISNLGKAGVSPKTAQVLARHSTIELT
ncbi:MAG: hypothetical protein ACRC2T_06430, partial [Thermoguttaceae bacterium]